MTKMMPAGGTWEATCGQVMGGPSRSLVTGQCAGSAWQSQSGLGQDLRRMRRTSNEVLRLCRGCVSSHYADRHLGVAVDEIGFHSFHRSGDFDALPALQNFLPQHPHL